MLRNILSKSRGVLSFANISAVTGLSFRGKNQRESRSSNDLQNGILHLISTPAASGAVVTENTALNVAAVTACVRLLADMIAKLPIYLYRDTPDGPLEVTDHPGIRCIGGIPSELHTTFELRQLMEVSKGLGGNGYARVYRDPFGAPRAIQWLNPYDVTPRKVMRPNGECYISYEVKGTREILTRHDILHVRGISRDGIEGVSPIRMLRESIGTCLAQTEAAGKLMREGTHFPGYLVAPQALSSKQMEDARTEWDRNTAGAKNAGRVPIMHGGFDFKQTNGMSMVDAEFLGSRRFELQEIARFYGIPAFMVGDSTASTTWGTGIEQQTLGFLNNCLDPHLVAWEQSMAMTLLTTQEQQSGFYFRFDRDALANADLASKAAYFQTMRGIGVYSVNDIRERIDERRIAPTDGGDDYALPFNNTGGAAQAKAAEPATEET